MYQEFPTNVNTNVQIKLNRAFSFYKPDDLSFKLRRRDYDTHFGSSAIYWEKRLYASEEKQIE